MILAQSFLITLGRVGVKRNKRSRLFGTSMKEDLLTALALVLIIEGLLPVIAPSLWVKVMRDAARLGNQGIRIAGTISMLVGALLLYILT